MLHSPASNNVKDGINQPKKKIYIRTPLIESRSMSKILGCDVYLKLENAQPSQSFKLRGISHLIQMKLARGYTRVVTSSGGNAGHAAAYTCRLLNVPVKVFIPTTTPEFAKQKLLDQNADVIVHGSVWDEANAKALEETAKDPKCAYIHPFDDPDLWEGHGTIIDELVEDLPSKPDLLVTVVGGGGLFVGLNLGLDAVGWNDVPVLAMETIGADCYNQSVKAGKMVTLPGITSVALCLGALKPCQRALDLYKERPILTEVITDKECIEACSRFLNDQKMLVEPACGAGLASVYAGVIDRLRSEGKLKHLSTVVIVVCGGMMVDQRQLEAWQQKFGIV